MAYQCFHLPTADIEPGIHLIEASAGTGKTYTLAGLYLRLLVEKKFQVSQILVVTFTEAATAELKERIRSRIREAAAAFASGNAGRDELLEFMLNGYAEDERSGISSHLQACLYAFDEAAIFTIHGFCQRLIREHAFETSSLFSMQILTDQTHLIVRLARDFWLQTILDHPQIDFLNLPDPKKFTPESLVELGQLSVNSPFSHVLPPDPGPQNLARDLSAYHASCRAVCRCWLQEEPIIRNELNSLGKSINKNSAKSILKFLPVFEAGVRQFGDGYRPDDELVEKIRFSTLQAKTKKNQTAPSHRFFKLMDSLFETRQSLNESRDRHFLHCKHLFLRFITPELAKFKDESGLLAFNDMLLKVHEAVTQKTGLREIVAGKFSAALIDEFQDTDGMQYTIFYRLFSGAHQTLFLIGDPKQAIYGFRGADIFAYLQAANQAAFRTTLDTNWRSAKPLVAAVNEIFHQPNVFNLPQIEFQPVKAGDDKPLLMEEGREVPAMIHWDVSGLGNKNQRTAAVQQAVGHEIARLLFSGQTGTLFIQDQTTSRLVQPRDIAVLVSNNDQTVSLQNILSAQGIQAVVSSSYSVFTSSEALEIHTLLAGIISGLPGGQGLAALSTPFFSCTAEDIAAVRTLQNEDWLEAFAEYKQIWITQGLAAMCTALFQKHDIRERFIARHGGERKLTNVLHLTEVLHRESMEQNLGPEALVQWLQLMISSPDPENEHHEMRLESDENALQIMTVHKSKGLEFPIVFCPNLQDWTPKRQSSTGFVHLPEKNQQSRVLHLDLNSDQQAAKAHQDEWLSESLRLTYVALTRARNRCYFCSLENEKNPKENPVSRLLQQKPLDQMPSVVTKNFPTNSPSPFSLYQSAPRLRLNVQRRRRTVPDRPRMASFSSLTRNRNPESFDRDYCDRQPWQAMPPESTEPDIFTFPRGTEGGIILHHILEHIDFNASQENWTTVVQENLQRHDLGPEWIPVILDMIVRLSGMDLGLGFTLAQVKRSCPEMQFMLPLQRLSPAKLQDIYAGSGIDTADVLAARLKTVSFQEVEGVLSGFADLVFIHENKWFVLDWKSNYLGPSLDDYRPSALWDSIVHSLYFLQYHFYALAVHRYAASRVLSYNFEKNFGGVFYVYLRGLNTDSDAAHGVHFACPPAGFMAHLEKNLCFNQTVFPERKNVQHH